MINSKIRDIAFFDIVYSSVTESNGGCKVIYKEVLGRTLITMVDEEPLKLIMTKQGYVGSRKEIKRAFGENS